MYLYMTDMRAEDSIHSLFDSYGPNCEACKVMRNQVVARGGGDFGMGEVARGGDFGMGEGLCRSESMTKMHAHIHSRISTRSTHPHLCAFQLSVTVISNQSNGPWPQRSSNQPRRWSVRVTGVATAQAPPRAPVGLRGGPGGGHERESMHIV